MASFSRTVARTWASTAARNSRRRRPRLRGCARTALRCAHATASRTASGAAGAVSTEQLVEPLPFGSEVQRLELELAHDDGEHVGCNAGMKLRSTFQCLDGILLQEPAHGIEQLEEGWSILHTRAPLRLLARLVTRLGRLQQQQTGTAPPCGGRPNGAGRGSRKYTLRPATTFSGKKITNTPAQPGKSVCALKMGPSP